MTYYLYIKTHNDTGLKYLGQTQKNPFKYKGSGKYWKRHNKTHGNNVTTQVLLATDSISELKQTGIFFSNLFNIVKSDEGKHNFKNKVPVVDKQGSNLIISRDEYIQQKSVYENIEDYPYVSNKSNEAKKRKGPWLYYEFVAR